MSLEKHLASLNSNIFLKEFTYSKNKFSPTPSSEYELADNIIWLEDVLIVFQLKEREVITGDTIDKQQKWYGTKVQKRAANQIKDTLRYLDSYKSIEISNERNHKFSINNDKITDIIKIIVFSSSKDVNHEHYRISQSAGFIHIFHIDDYNEVCKTFVTPREIIEYLHFRENVFSKWKDNTISVCEKSIIGQFLSTEREAPPDDKYLEHYNKFLNNIEDFQLVFHILGKYAEHLEYYDNEYDFYKILLAFTRLHRNDLKHIKERFQLCLDSCKNNQIGRPYRIVSSDKKCGFVMIPIPNEVISSRLMNYYHLKDSQKNIFAQVL